MNRAFAIWSRFIKTALIRDAEFRGDFVAGFAAGFGWLVFMFSIAEVVFGHTNSLAGWSKQDIQALIFAWTISQEMFIAFFYYGITQLSTLVHKGDFDVYLVRPFSALWQIAVSRFRLPACINIGINCVLFSLFLLTTGYDITLSQLLAFTALLPAAVIARFAIMLAMQSLSFWFINVDNVKVVYDSLMEIARFPTLVFRSFELLLFTAIPLAYLGNTQTQILMGAPLWHTSVITYAGACGALLVALLIYRVGIRNYSSASS